MIRSNYILSVLVKSKHFVASALLASTLIIKNKTFFLLAAQESAYDYSFRFAFYFVRPVDSLKLR